MKDALLDKLLDSVRDEAIRLGSDLIAKGISMARDRLAGKPNDAQVLEHLAVVQDKEVGR